MSEKVSLIPVKILHTKSITITCIDTSKTNADTIGSNTNTVILTTLIAVIIIAAAAAVIQWLKH